MIASLKSWHQYSHTWSLLCGLYDLIKIKFIPGQSLHLLCLSEIRNPKVPFLVSDLNIGWYLWAILMVSMILGSCYFCWWMVSMSLLIPLWQHTLSFTVLHWFLFHVMISKFRSNIRVIVGRSSDQQCLCLIVHAFSSWSSSSVLSFNLSMHLYGRFLRFWSNSFFVPRPDSFFHCDRNIFSSSWLNVGADSFLLF